MDHNVLEVDQSYEASNSPDSKIFTHGSLFAGIGGICTSFNSLGVINEFSNELEDKVIKTYQKNHPSKNFLGGSIRDLSGANLPTVDILHGGFPCQSFSIAGFKGGFNDPRGQLFFEITRLISEYGVRKPKILVFENAPNLLTGESGAWFRKISMEISKLGYWFDQTNALLLNTAEHAGIPQSRERLFIICLNSDYFDFNPIRQSDFSKVPLQPLNKFIFPQDEVDPHYFLDPENKYSRIIMDEENKQDPYQIYQLRRFQVRLAAKGMCPTLTANMGHGGHNVPFIISKGRIRKLTERECLNIQGFDKNFSFPDGISSGSKYAMIGNAVSPPISRLIANRVLKLLREDYV